MKNPKVIFIKNKWLGKYTGISLVEWIFVWDGLNRYNKPIVIRHEMIHTKQWRELWYIGFAILYPLFFLWYFITRLDGYRGNPFEREAYANDRDETYLTQRKKFAWTKYFKYKKS